MKSYNLIFLPVILPHPTPKPWKASGGDSYIICVKKKKGNIVSIIENADTIIKRKRVRISGGIEIGKLV